MLVHDLITTCLAGELPKTRMAQLAETMLQVPSPPAPALPFMGPVRLYACTPVSPPSWANYLTRKWRELKHYRTRLRLGLGGIGGIRLPQSLGAIGGIGGI